MTAVASVGCPVERGSFVDYREFSRELDRCHLHWNIKPINRHGFQARFSRREVGPIVFSEMEYEPIWGARGISDINRRVDCVIGLAHQPCYRNHLHEFLEFLLLVGSMRVRRVVSKS